MRRKSWRLFLHFLPYKNKNTCRPFHFCLLSSLLIFYTIYFNLLTNLYSIRSLSSLPLPIIIIKCIWYNPWLDSEIVLIRSLVRILHIDNSRHKMSTPLSKSFQLFERVSMFRPDIWVLLVDISGVRICNSMD